MTDNCDRPKEAKKRKITSDEIEIFVEKQPKFNQNKLAESGKFSLSKKSKKKKLDKNQPTSAAYPLKTKERKLLIEGNLQFEQSKKEMKYSQEKPVLLVEDEQLAYLPKKKN